MKRYLLNWLIWLDAGFNTLTGGDPLETMSSRAGKAQNEGKRWGCILCRFLNLFQRDHCQKSIDNSDGQRAVIPD